MKKNNNFKEIVEVLKSLNTQYPTQPLGMHISIATSDYPQLAFISDKELLFALHKYLLEKEMDFQSPISEEYYREEEEEDGY